ncbi:PQQ-dependent sugar dehydrogenase [Candidatus Falkowbacteria bacterium]|nr:PQQ-dependent sugar dehydrogenase [Candidatus Falkowbacteria bacterium]
MGISNKDFDSFSGMAPARLAGRILIKVEDLGKAYYVNPLNLSLNFLGRPADAFNLMRALGLGITNSNLGQIEEDNSYVAEEVREMPLQLIAQNLISPVALVSAPDSSGRLFVADQAGLIRIIDKNGNLLVEPFLDLRDKMVVLNPSYDERGLLGLAFHPNYKTNGRFFVYYSVPLRSGAPAGWNHTSRVSEFKVSAADSNKADIFSEKIILEVDKPQANHNAGQIAFGPDRMLYIPLGDGGQANDVGLGHVAGGNAQDMSRLLGKILRLDIDSSSPYAVPGDNPFVGAGGRDEIYASGLRNPFHISFDAGGSHMLIAADAGQNQWEEVNNVIKGGNYGWNIKEGRHCFDPENPKVSPIKNINQGIEGLGAVIIGGYVYRGNAVPGLRGKYIFGDWSKSFSKGDGTILMADMKGNDWPFKELRIKNMANGRLNAFLMGFGQDENNELYVLAKDNSGPAGATGRIYKIVSQAANNNENNNSNNNNDDIDESKVKIKNFIFTPAAITVKAGTKIQWQNEDSVAHTVTSAGNFDSGNIPANGYYELILASKGTYNYICTYHPLMKGTVIVQ